MCKTLVRLSLLPAVLLVSGCLFLFLDSTGGIKVDKDFTAAPPTILFLTIDGKNYELPVKGGIAHRENFYELHAELPANVGEYNNFSISFRDEVAVQTYGYEAPIGINYNTYNENTDSSSEWAKYNPDDPCSVVISRWDDKASFTFEATIYQREYSEEQQKELLSNPLVVSGRVQNAPFFNDAENEGGMKFTFTLNGEEKTFYCVDGGIRKGKYDYSVYSVENSYDWTNKDEFVINFCPFVTAKKYTSDSDITIRYTHRLNSTDTNWDTTSTVNEIFTNSYTIDITRWDEKVSFTFEGTLANGTDGSLYTVSGSVENAPVADMSEYDDYTNDTAYVTFDVDGKPVKTQMNAIYKYPDYSGTTYLGTEHYQTNAFKRADGKFCNLNINLPQTTDVGSFTEDSTGFDLSYCTAADSDGWQKMTCYSSSGTESTAKVTVTKWGSTASFSFSGKLYLGSSTTEYVEISGAVSDTALYKMIPPWYTPPVAK